MHESGEDYIETIYLLKKKKGTVRSIDVANELGFSRPSVSRAVGILKDNGLVTVADDGELVLTEEGLKTAKSVYEKHKNLTTFLMMTTGVDETIAENDACRIEHIISPETFKGIKKFIKEHKEQK
ncbi:metal-dependent transcriptional regulator [Butyrivibrio sp. INlla14]|uniref:metal-dependent transcriptional regulator n=1 Tax=Butyrivibrio sp. INlla14 TaxID=1520808 RepID=UPI00087728D2|nr:metal-dependent transcriptional regulator [Butyrivibrio sp. INlla14]SCX82849.1 iron (metal) dependent repressor, DtxR family [Butyrivibrio sp. INlla14]